MTESNSFKLWVKEIPRETWDKFLAESGREADNTFVRSLANMYNSFSGFYRWPGSSDELTKLPIKDGAPGSNLPANLALPDSWEDFEGCLEGDRAYIEMLVQGEKTRGAIFKDRAGRHFVGGFSIHRLEEDLEEGCRIPVPFFPSWTREDHGPHGPHPHLKRGPGPGDVPGPHPHRKY